MEIKFITTNKGKAKTLQGCFEKLGRTDIIITPVALDIVEPQADNVAEVSLFKARQAYEKLKMPVLVEDGGLAIDALNGFPGVYAKYVNEVLGAEGILKLLKGEKNRQARCLGTATYIDRDGKVHQFDRKGGKAEIMEKISPVDSPFAWSVLWKIIRIDPFDKVLAELTAEEVNSYYSQTNDEGSLSCFANWLVNQK
ncbi:MAG: hypothetical protein LBU87_02815 [Lactobacillales bacterium]|jgi:XTP/dITP diphosphohydrolase|nr:hypothetical protein [Lactobacillales bacterium]